MSPTISPPLLYMAQAVTVIPSGSPSQVAHAGTPVDLFAYYRALREA